MYIYISYYRYIYGCVVVRARAPFAIFIGESSETGLQPICFGGCELYIPIRYSPIIL